jgi:hypothetical protein
MRLAHSLAVVLLIALAGSDARAQEPSNPIRVVVFDIAGGVDAEGVGTLANVGKIIRDAKADIVFLQTVDSATTRARGVNQVHVLSSITGLRGVFAAMRRTGNAAQGLAILSRWGISRDTAAPASPQTAGTLDVSIEAPSGEVRVANLQADTTKTPADFAAALSAAAQSARLVAFAVMGADAPMPAANWQDAWTLCGPKLAETTQPDSAHAGHGAVMPPTHHIGLHLGPGLRCTEASRLAPDAGAALLFVVAAGSH